MSLSHRWLTENPMMRLDSSLISIFVDYSPKRADVTPA